MSERSLSLSTNLRPLFLPPSLTQVITTWIPDLACGLFVIPYFFFDPTAFWGSGLSSKSPHPFVINNSLFLGNTTRLFSFSLCIHSAVSLWIPLKLLLAFIGAH